MKRDKDHLVKLLRSIEESDSGIMISQIGLSDKDIYHLKLLCDKGYLVRVRLGYRMTDLGHDFLDNVGKGTP